LLRCPRRDYTLNSCLSWPTSIPSTTSSRYDMHARPIVVSCARCGGC